MPRPVSSTLETRTQFNESERSRVLAHMNEDHADALLAYARHFGGLRHGTAATMVRLSERELVLSVETTAGVRAATIALPETLHSAADAHRVLVRMAQEARRASATSPAAAPHADTGLSRAREVASMLRSATRTLMLATVSPKGFPDCSVAPFVTHEDGTFSTYVSELSAHTGNLRANGRASLLLIEDESSASHVLARKRVACACTARFVDRKDPEFERVLAALADRIGPVMDHLRTLSDFHVVRFQPERARLVAGFGQAYDLAPLDWSDLAHVTDKGHGRGTAKHETQ